MAKVEVGAHKWFEDHEVREGEEFVCLLTKDSLLIDDEAVSRYHQGIEIDLSGVWLVKIKTPTPEMLQKYPLEDRFEGDGLVLPITELVIA